MEVHTVDTDYLKRALSDYGFSRDQLDALHEADPSSGSFIELAVAKFPDWVDDNVTHVSETNANLRIKYPADLFMQVYQYTVNVSAERKPDLEAFKTAINRTGELLELGFTVDQITALLTNTVDNDDRDEIWDAICECSEDMLAMGYTRDQQVSSGMVARGANTIRRDRTEWKVSDTLSKLG